MRTGLLTCTLLLGSFLAAPACSSNGGGGGGTGGQGGAGGSGGSQGCGAFHCLHPTGICQQYSDDSDEANCTADPTNGWGPQACDNSGSFGGCRRISGSGLCSIEWYPQSLAGSSASIRSMCQTGSPAGAFIDLGTAGGGGDGGGAGGAGGAGGTGGQGGTGGTGGGKSGPITECGTHHCDSGVQGPTDVCYQFDDASLLESVICDSKVQGDGPCPDTSVGGCESQPGTPGCVVTVIYDPAAPDRSICESQPDALWLEP